MSAHDAFPEAGPLLETVPQKSSKFRKSVNTVMAMSRMRRGTGALQRATSMVGSVAGALQTDREPPKLVMMIFMLAVWVCYVFYVFGLPLWSYLFHDVLGYGAELCTMNADEVVCGNVGNYTDLARRLGRFRHDGSLWGCACGEGVFGDWACVTQSPFMHEASFSISFFVSAVPATGGLALFSSFPFLCCWLYGATNRTLMLPLMRGSDEEKHFRLDMITVVQGLSQAFYGVFQFASHCVFPRLHGVAVTLFFIATVLSFLSIAYSIGASRLESKVIQCIVWAGALAIVTTKLVNDRMVKSSHEGWLLSHIFWLGEAAGFSLLCSVPVVLVSLAACSGYADCRDDSTAEALADLDSSEAGMPPLEAHQRGVKAEESEKHVDGDDTRRRGEFAHSNPAAGSAPSLWRAAMRAKSASAGFASENATMYASSEPEHTQWDSEAQ